MNNTQTSTALEQLRDIHFPANPSMWPPAPGWWFLATLILFLCGWAIYKYFLYCRRKKQQAIIFSTLQPLEEKLLNQPNNKVLGELNSLLRQFALMRFPQSEVASLSGPKWLAFLNHSGKTKQFSHGVGRILADTPYLPEYKQLNKKQAEDLIKLVKSWIVKAEISA